ncbi:hypothetical protein LWI28_016208 [Acer negundo]|uniref:Uncharacterized protein n=1 Tax=Acer negundo TaxID=4023 RepID=A0AAD5NPK0_ACENE|nr:hypothetical protein LWI28_016208 [Acer negundo]KAK4843487.1 hypothetical protein QYF36_008637 [Acer negundo]
MEIGFMQPRLKASTSLMSSSFLGASSFSQNPTTNPFKPTRFFKSYRERRLVRRENIIVRGWLLVLPVDTCPWTLNIDSENNIASQLLSFLSLFPYMGFLYFISRSKSTPKLTLFGFYFLLAFVGAAVPAGLYAKVHYGTSLSNIDWLHGGAESLLSLTNLFIVLGLRQALRRAKDAKQGTPNAVHGIKEEKSSI